MKSFWRAAVAGLAFAAPLMLQSFPASGGTVYELQNDWRYLREAENYPYVGRVNFSTSNNQFIMTGYGSGTLIARQWVLTAAHVVDTATNINFEIGGQQYLAVQWFVPRTWTRFDGQGGPLGTMGTNRDIALIRLVRPVRGIRLADLETRPNAARNKIVTSVGYGATGDGVTGGIFPNNQRRAGRNVADVNLGNGEIVYDFDNDPAYGSSGPRRFQPSLEYLFNPDDELLPDEFFRIQKRDYPIAIEYAIAQGDSGGPVMRGHTVVGVHSYGTYVTFGDDDDGGDDDDNPTGLVPLGRFANLSASTNVATWRNWIGRVMRGGAAAGNVRAGSPGRSIFPFVPPDENDAANAEYIGTLDGKPLYGGAKRALYYELKRRPTPKTK